MILLHISLVDEEILLWAETQLRKHEKAPAHTDDQSPAPHPFAAKAQVLLDTIAGATDFFRPAKKLTASVAVWLPTYGGAPCPSNPLLAAEPAPVPASTELRAWIVDAIRLTPEELI